MSQSSFSSNNTLFLGDLSKFCVEEDLSALFGQFGEIVEIRIMRNSSTGKALSYGFIRFLQYDCAAAALASLNGMPFHGRHLRIGWAAHNVKAPKIEESVVNSVYVRFSTPQIDVYITEETIHQVFDKFGSVTDVSIKQSTIDPRSGTQSGYGFVHFTADQDGVEAAIRVLTTLNNTAVEGVNYSVEPSKNLLKQLNEMNVHGYGGLPAPPPPLASAPYSSRQQQAPHHKYSPNQGQHGRQQHQPPQHQGYGHQQQGYHNRAPVPAPSQRQYGFPEDRPYGQDLFSHNYHGQHQGNAANAYGGSYSQQPASYQATYAPVHNQPYAGRRSPPTAVPLTSVPVGSGADAEYYYARNRSMTMPEPQGRGSASGLYVTAPSEPMHGAGPSRPGHDRSLSLNTVDDILRATSTASDAYDFETHSLGQSRPPMLNLHSLRSQGPYSHGHPAAGGHDAYSGRTTQGDSFDNTSPVLTSRDSVGSRYSARPSTMDNTPRGTPLGFSSGPLGNNGHLDDSANAHFQRPPLGNSPTSPQYGYPSQYAPQQGQGQVPSGHAARRPIGVTDLDLSYGGLTKTLSSASCDRPAPLSLATTGTGVTDGEGGFFNSTSSSFIGELQPGQPRRGDGNYPGIWLHGASQEHIMYPQGGNSLSPRAVLQRKGSTQSVMTDAGEDGEALVEDEFTFLSATTSTNASFNITPASSFRSPYTSAGPSMDSSFQLNADNSAHCLSADVQAKMAQLKVSEQDSYAVASAGADATGSKPKSRQATLTQYFKATATN